MYGSPWLVEVKFPWNVAKIQMWPYLVLPMEFQISESTSGFSLKNRSWYHFKWCDLVRLILWLFLVIWVYWLYHVTLTRYGKKDFGSWICSKIRPWYQVEKWHLVHVIWWLFLEIPLYQVPQGKYHQTNFRSGFSSKIGVGYQVEREDLIMYAHFGKVYQNHS